MIPVDILERLRAVIEDRARERPDDSYVVQLLDGGVPAAGAKVLEEAEEVVDAARSGDAGHLAREVADLLFHTWIVMAQGGVEPEQVYAVLEERFGVGGLEEKRRRGGAGGPDDAG
jgi:phosphoribosyl-ATP pyrophosphohydrolase